MDQDTEEQNELLFTQALAAETNRDWLTVRNKCEQGLEMAGVSPERKMLFRMLRSHANMHIAGKHNSYDVTGAKLFQAVIEDAKKVINYSSLKPDSLLTIYLSQVHTDCGTALYGLSMTSIGKGRTHELMAEANEQFEKALAINPRNSLARKMLDSVERQKTFLKSKNGCFIATAVYGSAMASEVLIFRGYRDEILLKSFLGRSFVDVYYAISPSIANTIARSGFLRSVVRTFLLSPLLKIIRRK